MSWLGIGLLLSFAGPLRPGPELSPDAVVKTVAGALRHNNSPLPNSGIFVAYQFASPANRAVTGPYGRFLQAVKSQEFAPMLREYAGEFGPIRISGDRAEQVLRIPARQAAYRFVLTRQKDGFCRGCWMVDGVVRE